MKIRKRTVLIYFSLIWFILSGPSFADEDGHGRTVANVGGQARVRGDFGTNQNLGDFSYAPDTHDEQIISRTRLNLMVNPVKWAKGFVEGQFYLREDGKDYSKASLYQAYIELTGVERVPMSLKIGRQELCYGSTFFIGPNDFYDGLVWDAAKLRYTHEERYWIDLIAARYVKLAKNRSDEEPALYGGYSSFELTKGAVIEPYLFYHKGGFKFFHTDLPDSPHWYTAGMRIAGKIRDAIDYEIEPVYQFGTIDNSDRSSRDTISAYGGHVEAGYTFKSRYNPRVFAGYAFGSGDNDTSDKYYREFHGNIYNDNYIVADSSLIGDLSGVTVGDVRASGMHILVGGLSIDLFPNLNLNMDYHHFIADKTPAGISDDLGGEANFILKYTVLENFDIIASANRFFTGKFFEDAGGSGKDIDYFYVQAQLSF